MNPKAWIKERLDKARVWLAFFVARRYLRACIEEIAILKGQVRRERKRNEDILATIAKVSVSPHAQLASFGVTTWIDPSVVARYSDLDPASREIIKHAVEQHFFRHMRGAFTIGAKRHPFPRLNLNDLSSPTTNE